MGQFARNFRELEVYQKGLSLLVEVNNLTKKLPAEERFVLVDQMRRSSRSVCSNISEAWRKRRYKPAFISKLNDAESEASEMQCWLDVARKLNFIKDEEYNDLDAQYEQIIGQLVTMINHAGKWCLIP